MINFILGQFQWYRNWKGGTWEKRKLTVTCVNFIPKEKKLETLETQIIQKRK